MSENRVKLVIEGDATGAITTLGQFVQALDASGASAKLSDAQLAKLADRFRDKLGADQAQQALDRTRQQIERIGTAAGLSQQELAKLQNKFGLLANSSGNAQSSLAQLASGATSAGGSLAGLATKVGVAVAAYFSLKEALSFLSDAIMSAARYETLGVVLTKAGENAGYAKDQMMGFAEGVEKAGISMIDSRESVAKMAVAQLDLSKASELATVAQGAATVAGTSSTEAFAKLVQGITTGQTILLHHQGIMVNLEEAYKKYADANNTTVLALSATQKANIALNAVLDYGSRYMSVYGSAMETAGKQLTSFSRYISDLKTTIGDAFLDQFTETVFNSATALKQLKDVMATPEAQEAIASLTSGVSGLVNFILQNIPAAIQVFSKLISVINTTKDVLKDWRTSLPEYFGVFGDAAVKAIDLFAMTNTEKLQKMSTKLAEMKDQYANMADGAEKINLGQQIDKGTQSIQAFSVAAKNAHNMSNRILPSEEDAKALNKWLAEYNAGLKKYKEAVQGAINIGEGSDKEKYKPIAEQKQDALDSRNKELASIDAAKKLAEENGQLEDVRKLTEAATVAQGKYNNAIDALDRKANRGSKAAQNAAIAAERYGSQAESYLENVENSLQSMEDTLSGAGNKESGRVDKWFTQAINQAQKAMIGAKGDASKYQEAIDLLTSSYQKFHDLAVAKDTITSLKAQAEVLSQLAQALDDPGLSVKSSNASTTAWTAEMGQKINGLAGGEASKVWDDAIKASKQAGADLNAIWQGVAEKWTAIDQDRSAKMATLDEAANRKRLEGQVNAYKDYAAVSSTYWEAEKELLQSKLETAKKYATDETAYKIYEAQQWDAYNQKFIEQQEQSAGSLSETLSAKWALHFGSYKSEVTKAKESWESMSDSVINGTDSMIDGVSGGFGDIIRNVGSDCGSIESLWKSMLSRMLDAFASFFEDIVKQKLKDLVSGLFSGDSATGSTSTSGLLSGMKSLLGGSTDASGSSSSILDGVKDLGKEIGKESGLSLGDYFSTAGESDVAMFAGADNAMAKIFSDGVDMSKLGSTAWSAGSAAMTGASMLSTVGTILGGIGVVGGIVGLVSGLFGNEEKKVTKTASGSNVMYSDGKTVTSGIDFYSDGSTVSTGVGDPAVTKKISDAFKATSEKLKDFADALDIGTTALQSFSMPSMNITDSQLDSYTANGSNLMTFQWLNQNSLLGIFNELAQDGEVWSDEVDRLSTSYSTGANKLEAYGFNMADVAQITDASLASMRTAAEQSASDTTTAMLTMASAAGLSSDQIQSLSDSLSNSASTAAVTDDELSKLMEASWVSDATDKVGGTDAFNTVMDNLISNEFNTISKYADNLDYYNSRANDAIAKIGDDSVTVSNFWDSFDAALKAGMSTDQFETWSKASTWVASVNSVNDALAQWNEGMLELNENLDARMESAQGYTYEASVTKQLATAEKELYDARQAGYGAAYITRLQEVQAAELQAIITAHNESYASAVLDATKTYATAVGDSATLVQVQMQENAKALKDLEKEYNNSVGSSESWVFTITARAQYADLIKTIEGTAEATAKATASMEADLSARNATVAGYDAEADALQKVSGYTNELTQAYADGLSDDLISKLMQTELDELAKYWTDTIKKMKGDLQDLYKTQSELLSTLSGNTQTAIQELYALFTRYQAGEDDLADDIISSLQSIASAIDDMVNNIYDTIYKIRTGDDTTTDTAEKVASNTLAYFNEQYTKAASGDTDAMSNISSYATDYLGALKKSTADESVYQGGEDYVISMLSKLASGATASSTGLSGIATSVTNNQIAAAEKALKQAEVAQLETTYQTLYAQALSAFKSSQAGTYISAFATTGAGWSAFGDLFVDYNNDGTTRLQEIQSGQINWVDYIGWFLSNYGTGSGAVDWDSALPLWRKYSGSLPSGVESLYQQAQSAYASWQNLKTTYGFASGGVISSDSDWGDNTLVRANDGERILTPSQNEGFEELVFGDRRSDQSSRSDDLVVALIARVDRLTDAVTKFQASNTEEHRGIAKRVTSIDSRQDDWTMNGSLRVGVSGTVKVETAES